MCVCVCLTITMNAEAIALLQQLASNPGMVQQLQGVLSLLSDSAQQQSQQGGSSDHSTSSTNTAASTPSSLPSTASAIHHVSGNSSALSQDALLSSSSSSLPAETLGQQRRPAVYPSRPPTAPDSAPRYFGKSGGGSGGGLVATAVTRTLQKRSNPNSSSAPAPSPAASPHPLEQRCASLERHLSQTEAEAVEHVSARVAAENRVQDLERELQRVSQRVEQLTSVVQEQRQQLRSTEEKHQLELEEVKHSFDVVLQRKEEVHREAMRQMTRSRQLLSTAKRFECTVKAGGGLSVTKTPLNVQLSSHGTQTGTGKISGSDQRNSQTGVKRERAPSEESTSISSTPFSSEHTRHDSKYEVEAPLPYSNQRSHTAIAAADRTPGQSTGKALKKEEGSHPYFSRATTTTAASSHSVTPLTGQRGKQSTVLTGRTVSRSGGGKRRTPRTPSLTHADRVAGAGSYRGGSRSPLRIATHMQNGTITTAAEVAPPLRPRLLPGTSSVKLDSPTPTSSTRGGTRYKNEEAVTDVDATMLPSESFTAPAYPVSTTVTGALAKRHHQQRQQQQEEVQQQQQQTKAFPRVMSSTSATPEPKTAMTLTTSPSPATAAANRFVDQYAHRSVPLSTAANTVGTSNTTNAMTRVAAGAAVAGRCRPVVSPVPRAPPGRMPTSATSSIAAGTTRSPSPVNPKRGPQLPRRFIFTGLKDDEPARLREAIESIGEDAVALSGDYDEPPPMHTTHIVVRGTPRSVKALCGVVSGKWLVPPEYIYNSAQAGFWLDEFEEDGLRIFPPPLKCQRFLLTVEQDGIRQKLAQVIEYGGGEVIPCASSGASRQWTEQGVVVITSGDDLLRYATQPTA